MFDVGDRVTWQSQAAGGLTTKTGVIVRVIQKHETPAYRIAEAEFPDHRRMFDGRGIPGNSDVGYFVEVRGGKTARARPKLYFPYPRDIAPAPDLYSELKYAVECVEAGCMPNADWVGRAKAAMAGGGE